MPGVAGRSTISAAPTWQVQATKSEASGVSQWQRSQCSAPGTPGLPASHARLQPLTAHPRAPRAGRQAGQKAHQRQERCPVAPVEGGAAHCDREHDHVEQLHQGRLRQRGSVFGGAWWWGSGIRQAGTRPGSAAMQRRQPEGDELAAARALQGHARRLCKGRAGRRPVHAGACRTSIHVSLGSDAARSRRSNDHRFKPCAAMAAAKVAWSRSREGWTPGGSGGDGRRRGGDTPAASAGEAWSASPSLCREFPGSPGADGACGAACREADPMLRAAALLNAAALADRR